MKYISIGLVLLVAACAQPVANVKPAPAEYSIPTESGESRYSRTFNKSYDDVRYSVIDHVHSVFDHATAEGYTADYVENKWMGVIVRHGWIRNISKYVNCRRSNKLGDKGNYADYLKHHAQANLRVETNFYVQEIAENKTYLRVLTQYLLTARFRDDHGTQDLTLVKWDFNSGEFHEIDPPGRALGAVRCQPTHAFEESFLDAASSD